MRPRPLLIALAPVLLLATGCAQKLNESKTLTLDAEHPANALLVPAQKKAMKLKVDFSSSSGDVSVFVFKESDIKNDDEMATVQESLKLAGQRGKDGSFAADVPADTATRVVARHHTAAKTDVALKVTNAP